MADVQFGDFSTFSRSNQRYLFVFNDVEPDLLESTHDLGAGWHLRRATWSELDKFGVKHHFEDWQRYSMGDTHRLPHAYPREDGKYDPTTVLADDKWRLTLVYADDKVGIGPNSMTQALAICNLQLLVGASSDGNDDPMNCGFWPRFGGYGVRTRQTPTISQGKLNSAKPFPMEGFENRTFGRLDDLENARKVIECRRREAPEHVLNAIYHFLDLDRLPDYAELKHLGYFALLESLLSHAPQEGDRVDSISRQLRRNLSLVNYRLEEFGSSLPLEPFGEAGLDKVIARLYSYRSTIAHGGNIKSALAGIDKLRIGKTETNMRWMHDYMRTLVRRVLQSAIREPDLFLHLK